jgi:hypothetical protein
VAGTTYPKWKKSFVVYKGVVDRASAWHSKALREFAKNPNQDRIVCSKRALEDGLLILFVWNALEFNPVLREHRE